MAENFDATPSGTKSGRAVLRPSTRPQRESGDRTRRRLLQEGRIAFARDGLDGASMKPILDAVGVAPTVLYHHFGSKNGFFVAVAEDVYAVFVAELRTAIAQAADFDSALSTLIDAAAALHRKDPTLAGVSIVVQFEARRNREIRRELTTSLSAFVALATEIADLAPDSVRGGGGQRAVVLALVALLNGLSSLAVTVADSEDFVAAAHALRRVLSR
ncbi:TetR/AcrR family transcriptional regulator [Nocardia sp. R16R-3T]